MKMEGISSLNLLLIPGAENEMNPDQLVRISKWKIKAAYKSGGELYVAVEEETMVEFVHMPQSQLLEIIQGES
jgi:hypothetical protein